MPVAQPVERKDGVDQVCTASEAIRAARQAQLAWSSTPLSQRLTILRRFRGWLAEHSSEAVQWIAAPWRSAAAETLAAEVLPLLEAGRFLEENAEKILQGRRPAGRKPFWIGRTDARIEREPLGVVLVLAPANYPLFLPGCQTLQALAAGNAVVWKPGRLGTAAAEGVRRGLSESGLPTSLLQILPEDVAAGVRAIRSGVDKVVLTGSLEAGRDVLTETAQTVTPSTMELSGVDACFVLPDADLDLVVDALRFGLEWNAGFTCIAPRRVFVHQQIAGQLASRLDGLELSNHGFSPSPSFARRLQDLVEDAEGRGARRLGPGRPGAPILLFDVSPNAPILRHDPQGPLISIVPVASMESALEIDQQCPFALGATVFGSSDEAHSLAKRIKAGIVVINDVIAPTADPRLPFGGCGWSGFGVTRGEEGLLEMTRPKAIVERQGDSRPHLQPSRPKEDRELFESYIHAVHVRGAVKRLKGLRRLVGALISRSR